MSSLTVEEDQKWVPTHVQVTVLRGRGLRGKGKHGTSDVYTIIQLGKEKYSTGVAEKTTEPEWREECSFELQPGVLDSGGGGGGRSGSHTGSNELILTVMHRALMGLDVFLGQAVIRLDKVFQESRCVKNEWYRLNSKTGKKEKERGDIQVTVQFTRNNMTASMYDLVMKDKSASTFGKLKERMRGKRRSSDEDSSSAILPGGYGNLCRMRQRLPSDGGGEEDYEDDEGGELRRSKMRTFFLRGKLRKSSDTRSSTSLGSESSESSSRGGSLSPTAGISVVVSDLSNSPSNSSNLTADNSPEHTGNTSPKSSSSLKCEFGDEAGEITIAVPLPTVCVNGSHAYHVQPLDPGSGKPAGSLGLGLLQKSLPLSMSLQNLSPRASSDLPKGPVGDGRRWSFDKPGEEEKAAIAAALEQSGPMVGDEEEDERLGQAAPPKVASSAAELESQGKKQRRNLFSHGKSESAGKGQSQSKDESEQAPAATEEKHRGWFGSKDSHSKLSLVVSPKLKSSTDPHPPPLPLNHHPPGPPVDPLHHTNPFTSSQSTPPPISPCNPFFSLLQHNPFYEDMLTAQPLKPSLPPLPYLSSSRPPIAQLFPQPSNPNPTLTQKDSITGAKSEVMAKVEKRPLPPIPTEGETPLSERPPNPFVSARKLEPDSEWDESFEAFAAGRLQSPEDLTTNCKTQQNTPKDEHCKNKGALLPAADDTLHHQSWTEFGFETHKATNTHHFDTFAQFLETIPEHTGFDSESPNSPNLAACTETNQANSMTNTNVLTDTNTHQVPCHTKLNSSSPDPGSSGLGSSAEEDFLSCLSSYSDKFSASSSEEAEAPNFESSTLGFEKPSQSIKHSKPSESEDDNTDRSNDLSLGDQHTIIQHRDGDEKLDVTVLEQPLITGKETPTPELSEPQLKSGISLKSDSEHGEEDTAELNTSLGDFPKMLNDSSAPLSMTPVDELCSTHPSVHIITSSPDVRQSSLDVVSTILGNQSPIPFGLDLLNTSGIASSPSQGIEELHTRSSDQSTSSFLQSLYVSVDSQDYQTCVSHPSSELSSGSEPNVTLHSANSTLCAELSGVQTPAGAASGQEDFVNACKPSEDQTEDKMATLETSFTIGGDVDSFPKALTDSRKLNDKGAENQHDEFSKCPQILSATKYSSHSEGTLAPVPDKVLLLPSSGIDQAKESFCGAKDKTASFTIGGDLGLLPPTSSSKPSMDQEEDKLPTLESSSMIGGDLDLLPKALTESGMLNEGGVDEYSNCPQVQSVMLQPPHSKDTLTSALLPTFGSDQAEELFGGAEDKMATLEPSVTIGDDFGLLPSANACKPSKDQPDDKTESSESSFMSVVDLEPEMLTDSRKLTERVAVTCHDEFSKCLQGQCGASTPTQDKLPLPSFGNDQAEESLCGANGEMATIETSFTIGDDLGLLNNVSADSKKLTEGSGEEILKGPWVQGGTLTPALDEPLLPSVGSEQGKDSFSGAENKTASPELSFVIGGDLDLLPRASADSVKLAEGGVDEFSKCRQVQSATLHRSHSEGTLTPAIEELLLPSFGSDPGAIQESFSADPGHDLPSLTFFAPTLTPDSSSLVALCSLPSLANATARSLPSVARAAVPKPNPQDIEQQRQAANPENSPHPVRPLTTAILAEEKRTEGRSVLATGLEKLKSTIHPGRSSQLSEQETERKKSVTEGAGSYYHLNHNELVALLVQREAELERQKREFEKQKLLLAKREVELKKLKPQVRDLEDYIDTLLVRIMEQKPTLLQVRSKLK